jgi:hypothetical protein
VTPFRSKTPEASRSKAETLKHKRASEKNVKVQPPAGKSRELHIGQTRHIVVREIKWVCKRVLKTEVKSRSGWRCAVCKATSSSKTSLEQGICRRSVRERQLDGIHKKVSDLFAEADGHRRVRSGEVEWCHLCGCFTENRSKGLSALCTGIPRRGNGYGGMWGQRRKLLQGIHPKTNMPLPLPRNFDGTLWNGVGDAQAGLQGNDAITVEHARDDGFYTYIPTKFVKVNSGESKPSQSTFSELLSRTKAKEACRKEVVAVAT